MSGPPREHVILTLRLPDRPGALGAVASRIGSLGADITDVTIRRRGHGLAEDVLHIDLPTHHDLDVVGLLLAEIGHVDGVEAPSLTLPDGSCCCTPVAD
jgi:prephenate dehydratase